MNPDATALPGKRNTVISICKGLAIILMVIGHAEAPDLLTRIIYTFHMPLFFITAGYFFSARNADEPWKFCARRFKGLYIPFLKWSLFFLLWKTQARMTPAARLI
jgi:fucose 4-O-acetylase-like acetyltransferase